VIVSIAAFGFAALVHQNKAAQVIGQVLDALKEKRSFELSISGEMRVREKMEPVTAEIKLWKDPLKIWCKLHCAEFDQYSALDGLRMLYTDDDGSRQSRELPSARIIMNLASALGIYAWDALCDVNRYTGALGGNSFFVQSEEVEGHPCDLIGLITPPKGASPGGNIRYLWVDQQTHLPQAYQLHSFIRGHSETSAKWTIESITPNPTWVTDPFDSIPDHAPIRIAIAPAGMGMPSETMRPGDHAGGFPIQTPDGAKTDLASQIYGETLVAFWAPWCGPCQEELKALSQMPEVTTGKLRVLAIGLSDSKQHIRAFAAKGDKHIRFFMDPDAERSASLLKSQLAPDGIPHAYLFDANGRLIRQWLGFSDAKELKANLAPPKKQSP
jgi:thiol-disulfide isomerase/thioredoxin